jgi:hypothetical protein
MPQFASIIIGLLAAGATTYIVFNEMQSNDNPKKLAHQNKKETINFNDKNIFVVDAKELAQASNSQDNFLKNLVISLLCGAFVGVITKVGSQWVLTTESDFKPNEEKQAPPTTEFPRYNETKQAPPTAEFPRYTEQKKENPEDQKDDIFKPWKFKPWKETAEGKKAQKEWDEISKPWKETAQGEKAQRAQDELKEKQKKLWKSFSTPLSQPFNIHTFQEEESDDLWGKYKQQPLNDIWMDQHFRKFYTQPKEQPYEKIFTPLRPKTWDQSFPQKPKSENIKNYNNLFGNNIFPKKFPKKI